jgi:hypothetical protein
MKYLGIAIALLTLTSCAGTPAPESTAAQQAAANVDVTDPKKVDTDTIMAAQDAGQKIVQEDGQEMICRREKQTGSHLQKKTICMTREDWDKAAAQSRQTMEDIARQRPPRQGN